MPRPPEDVLKDLVAATDEAKATIRELHSARATALDVDKKHRERITQLIVEEVTKQVEQLAVDAHEELRAGVAKIIGDLTSDLQRKLLG